MRKVLTSRHVRSFIAIAAALVVSLVATETRALAQPVDITAITRLAESGSAADQSRLGWMFFNGKDLPRDTQLAFHWFLNAAEQGDAEGLRGLQSVYLLGEEVIDGSKKGLDLITDLSKKTPSRPNSATGAASADGRDVGNDAASKLARYTKAAAQGDPAAQSALGEMYCQGKGVERDYAKAMSLQRQAAEQGYAMHNAGWAECTRMVLELGLMPTKQSGGTHSPQLRATQKRSTA